MLQNLLLKLNDNTKWLSYDDYYYKYFKTINIER